MTLIILKLHRYVVQGSASNTETLYSEIHYRKQSEIKSSAEYNTLRLSL
jgi:hypothetical protein